MSGEENTIFTVAHEIIKRFKLAYDDKIVAEKVRNYISNCMEVLGASLKEFSNQETFKYKITNELKVELTCFFGSLVIEREGSKDSSDNTLERLPSKEQLSKSINYHPFGNESVTEDIVFVAKEFIKANFNDDTYEEIKKKIRDKITELETSRKIVLERVTNSLTNDLFFLTFNRNIFDSVTMDKYFMEVKRSYKEYETENPRRLNEKDLVLLNFLGFNSKLKIIEKQFFTEIIKDIALN